MELWNIGVTEYWSNERMKDFDKIFSSEIFKSLMNEGLIDCIAYRNIIIKKEYRTLRLSLHALDAIEKLAEKHCLSESAIMKILFRKRKRKTVNYELNPSTGRAGIQK